MLFRSQLLPESDQGVPEQVLSAAQNYKDAHERTLEAEHEEAVAKQAMDDAEQHQLRVDSERVERGEGIASQALLPKARGRLDKAKREANVAREVQAKKEQELIAAIDATYEDWREEQEDRLAEIVDDYNSQLDRLVRVSEELSL
jgi:hypothetical protein